MEQTKKDLGSQKQRDLTQERGTGIFQNSSFTDFKNNLSTQTQNKGLQDGSLQEKKRVGILPNSFYKTSIIKITKIRQGHPQEKKITGQYS